MVQRLVSRRGVSTGPWRRVSSLIAILKLLAMLSASVGVASAQAIAYDTNSAALTATADYYQNVTSCGVGCGDCPPSSTVNGSLDPYDLGGNLINAWAVAPNQASDHFILWNFVSGTLLVNAIQIINVYPYGSSSGPHFIGQFSLDYTVDPNPSLNSAFLPLDLVGLQGASGSISGNAVATSGCADLRVLFTPTAATAIRLHSFPNAGISDNKNFVISEVSFDTCTGTAALYGTSLVGAGGIAPTLSEAGCPGIGEEITLHIDMVTGGAPGALFVGLTPAALPFKGGLLEVSPILTQLNVVMSGLPGVAGAGSLMIPAALPNDTALHDLSVYLQGAFHDDAAVQKVSLTAGLQITVD